MAKAGKSGQWSPWCGNNRISTVTMRMLVSLSVCVCLCMLLLTVYPSTMTKCVCLCALACCYLPCCCRQAAGQAHREKNKVVCVCVGLKQRVPSHILLKYKSSPFTIAQHLKLNGPQFSLERKTKFKVFGFKFHHSCEFH